jgi:hypothetical protein
MAKQVAKKTGFKDLERLIRGNEEQEIQAAQEENKLLLQGVRQIVTPNENHDLHLKVHGQVYKTPGMNITPEFDEHVQTHGMFYQQQMPQLSPQKGDTKPGALTTMPELKRRGVPDNVDLVGGATNIGQGTGVNI